MKYFEELKKSMNYLAKNKRTIFLGQAIKVPGTAMSNTFKEINLNKLIELPVAEEMQMGMTNGFAINGLIPVSVFPRWNFLLLAMNQLINHLDKIKLMSNDEYKTKVIVRTGIGSEKPLHPQYQHLPRHKACKQQSHRLYGARGSQNTLSLRLLVWQLLRIRRPSLHILFRPP